MAFRAPLGFALVVVAIALSGGACTCSKGGDAGAGEAGVGDAGEKAAAASGDAGEAGGLSAPIAASRIEAGDVVVDLRYSVTASIEVDGSGREVRRDPARGQTGAQMRLLYREGGWVVRGIRDTKAPSQ